MEPAQISGMKSLKAYREQHNYTEYKMAKLLGISQTSYRHLEGNAKGITFRRLIDLKTKLGLSWVEIGQMIEKEFK